MLTVDYESLMGAGIATEAVSIKSTNKMGP